MKRVISAVLTGIVVGAMATSGGLPAHAQGQQARADGPLSVRVVRDVNGNGSYDAALEVGVAGIPVAATDPAGTVASGTTGPDGTVALNLGTLAGGKYRVEATIPPDKPYLKPAPAGGTLSSLTEFVDVSGGKAATLTMGVWNPADYCQANPRVATACQLNRLTGSAASLQSVLTFPYTATGLETGVTAEATQGQTGAVMGIAYSRTRQRIFSGAIAKRLTGYGPNGPGGIYLTDPAANTTTPWATVPNAGSTAHNDAVNQDGGFFPVAGKESLGDIELSEDDSRLFVVNMADKKLYTYDATQTTASAPLSSVAIPSPCPSAGDWRPGALKVRDGVVYVGGVCSAQSTQKRADLRAVVYRFDPVAGTFSAPIVSKVLDFQRGYVSARAKTVDHWVPWEDSWNLGKFSPADVDGKYTAVHYPSPLLTDIELEANGDLVLGFRDRFSDQVGSSAKAPNGTNSGTLYTGISGGDINRVCVQTNGSYAWEGTAANCPSHTTSANSGGEPTSVIEFYPTEQYQGNIGHQETAQGGLAINYSSPYMLTTAMDPLDWDSGGVLQAQPDQR